MQSYLASANVYSIDDNLFELNPTLTEPYEKFILETEIEDGSPTSVSQLKQMLMKLCSESNDPRVQIRHMLMMAFKDYSSLLSPYIDRDTIIKTRTETLANPSVGDIEAAMNAFLLSKYSIMSPIIYEASKETGITPKSALSMLCAFVAWRYIYVYNRKQL